MKNTHLYRSKTGLEKATCLLFCFFFFSVFYQHAFAQSLGIWNDNTAPGQGDLIIGNAIIPEVMRISKDGMVIPQLTTTERNAIVSPINSMFIFNTTAKCYQIYNANAVLWEDFYCYTGIAGCDNPPTTAAAGTDQNLGNCVTTATLAGNTPTVGTGLWTVVSGTATITTPTSPTSGVTGLAASATATLRWTISNALCADSFDEVVITTTSCVPPSCGTQVWATANINVGTRINGAPGGQNMTAPGGDQKYCYNDIEANCTTYGGLYEWGEAMNYAASVNCDPCGAGGVQGICPAGYHIPTDLEWSRYEYCIENTIAPTGATTLATFQTTTGWRGTNSSAGPGAKIKVTSGNSPAWDGTNTSGFSALPAGYRFNEDALFYSLGSRAYFWSATYSGTGVWSRNLDTGSGQSYRTIPNPPSGFSVRCLQN